jgi:uncharacterized membrane protein
MPILYKRSAIFLKHLWQQLSSDSVFLAVAGVAGLAFCIITPPFQVPDEIAHYYRAYQVSEGHLVARPANGGYGDLLPEDMEKQVKGLVGTVGFNPETKYDAGKSWRNLRQPLDSKRLSEVDFENTAAYSPMAYMPQAVGVGAARTLKLSLVAQLFLGRLVNLAVWIALVFCAIRLIPFGKWALFALALTPMSLFEAASVSPDALVNGSAFLFAAVCLRLILATRAITRWEYTWLVVPVVIFALTKVVYLPLTALLILVPAKNFGSSRKKWIFITAALMTGLLLAGLWNYRVRHIQELALAKARAEVGSEITPRQQLKFITSNPTAYVRAILNSYVTTRGDHIEQEFIGVLGWLDTKIPLWITTLDIVLIAYCLASIQIPRGPTLRERAVTFLAAFVSLVGATTALYVYYTPVGYLYVVGLQGRYLIPLSPLLIPLAANLDTSVRPPDGSLKVIAAVTSVTVLMLSLCVLFFRYYAV